MIDYTLTIPLNKDLLLQKKIQEVPAQALDRLHPSKKEGRNFAEYIDQGLWKSCITYQTDSSFSVLKSKWQAQSERGPFKNLDQICEEELRRRFPDFQVIHGLKAHLKDTFPILSKAWMGKEQFYRELTEREVDQLKRQISFSAIDRDDLICHPTIEDKQLRHNLKLQDDSLLETHHLLAKNSPMNGKAFDRDGKIIYLSQGISSTSDRTVENTGNLRLVQTKKGESICYAGRPDTEKKALEQASFIFFNEIKSKRKGITETKDAQGNSVYQLDYAVNSLLTSSWIGHFETPIVTFPERTYLENELKAFDHLKNKGVITIEDPQCPGAKYKVKFNPILFSNVFDSLDRLKSWLPPFFTGHSRSVEISEEGYFSLTALARQKLTPKIVSTLKLLERSDLAPEEELFARDYLCKLLGIPTVYHCKSSVDRTSMIVALSSALQQWMDLGLPLPENICGLIDDYRFKELFAANWMAGHQMTRYACNRKGTVAGQKLKTKTLGFTLHRGLIQNPRIARLLPQRYLTDFPMKEKMKAGAFYALSLIPVVILFYLPLMAITAARHLGYLLTGGKNRHWLGPLPFTLPFLPLTLIFNFPSVFPKKVLNEKSPQIKHRSIIASKRK